MVKAFEFQDGGRTYTCTVEERKGAAGESWWWFAVTGDAQRYAPFRTASGDTRASVQERMVQFYTDRLFRLTQPTVRGGQWGNRKSQPTADAAKGTAPPASDVT